MEATIQQVEQIVSVLTADEKQLLKDTINEGGWGDSDGETRIGSSWMRTVK